MRLGSGPESHAESRLQDGPASHDDECLVARDDTLARPRTASSLLEITPSGHPDFKSSEFFGSVLPGLPKLMFRSLGLASLPASPHLSHPAPTSQLRVNRPARGLVTVRGHDIHFTLHGCGMWGIWLPFEGATSRRKISNVVTTPHCAHAALRRLQAEWPHAVGSEFRPGVFPGLTAPMGLPGGDWVGLLRHWLEM